MATFQEFMRQMMANGDGGPMPEPAPTPGSDPLKILLMLLQQGADASRGERAQTSPLQPFAPGMGGPLSLGGSPDAGDLYDFNYSNGDPGLLGLFGSGDPVPLRQPAPGINPRRPYRRGMP